MTEAAAWVATPQPLPLQFPPGQLQPGSSASRVQQPLRVPLPPTPGPQQWVLVPAWAAMAAAQAGQATAAMPAQCLAAVSNAQQWSWLGAVSNGFPASDGFAAGPPSELAAWQEQQAAAQEQAATAQRQQPAAAAAQQPELQPLAPALSLGNWQLQPPPQQPGRQTLPDIPTSLLNNPLASRSIGGLDWGDLQVCELTHSDFHSDFALDASCGAWG